MKTFVTGGSGHVGANLIRELVRRGVEVRALARKGSNNEALEGLDIEIAYGDLRDQGSLVQAMRGCDRMYHVAAFVSLRAGDRRELFEVNVEGARRILEAAADVGIEKTVFCSSFGAVGIRRDGRPSDETCTIDPFDLHLDYELSKAISEIEALRAANRGQHVVIVNPSGVVGPYDFKPSSVGQVILDIAHRKMHFYIPGAFDFVPVRDVVQGHILAMERGRSGERYILGGGLRTLDQLLDHLCAITGAPKPRGRLPAKVLGPLSHVSNFVLKRWFPDRPARFTPGTIRLLTSGKAADISKAKRELGYSPTSIEDAFTEQYEWFKSAGRIRNGHNR